MTDQGSYIALAQTWADDPWFRFPRAFIRDARLSATARALAAWMASHSTTFRFSVATMMKAGLGGRDKVRNALKELEEHGYLVRTRERNPDGSFGRIIYQLHPTPQENPRSCPAPENQAPVPAPENQAPVPEPENQAPVATSENTAKPQVATGDGKPGPDFQGGFKGEQPQVDPREKEGEEGARVRASDSSPAPGETSSGGWGVAPAAPSAAADRHGTLFARTVLADIAQQTGLGLADWQHKRLATDYMPAALEAVRELGDPAVTGTELCTWLTQGHETTESLYAVLSRRLSPDYLKRELPAWVARQQHTQGYSAPPVAPQSRSGDRDADAWQPSPAAGRCPVHRVDHTADGRCLDCQREADPTQRPATGGEGEEVPEDAAAETDQSATDTLGEVVAALPSDPDAPFAGPKCDDDRCISDRGSPRYRMVVRMSEGEPQAVPCPRCGQRTTEATDTAA